MYTLCLLLLVLILIYVYFKCSLKYWKNRGVPYLEPKIPVGNANLTFFFNQAKEISRLYFQYKKMGLDYAGFYLLVQPVLIPVNPEIIKMILSTNFNHFGNRGMYCNVKKDPLTENLVCMDVDRWHLLRLKLTPIFFSGKLKMMSHIMLACGENLVKTAESLSKHNNPIDLRELSDKFTIDIIASAIFGIECDSLNNPETPFQKSGRQFCSPNLIDSLRMITGVIFPKALELFNVSFFPPKLTNYFCDVMKEIVNYREQTKFERNDFMNLLIRLKNKKNLVNNTDSDVGITMDELMAQGFVFYLAGFETSATTLMYCLFEMSQNIEIQQKLREEIKRVLYKYDGQFTYDAIMEMNYLDKIVHETLRKYPPVVILNRMCTEDFTLPKTNITIEKGTSVIIPIIGIHRDPSIYPEPEEFDPERFSPEEKAKRHPFTYLPFGEGPRNCIGLRFGLLEIKIGVAKLVHNFLIKTHPKSDVPLKLKTDVISLSHYGNIFIEVTKI